MMPAEAALYILCRHIYHAPPDVVLAQDDATVRAHLEMWNADQRIAAAREEAARKQAGGGKA